jgi:N-ethylmaleimide reductase
MPSLFDPIKLGAILCPNRVVMAPLTRARATRSHVPTELMKSYYVQRAGAGLITTEATGISRQGLGWPFAPGIWNDEQVAAWTDIVSAVHAAGGRIFCQLWHMGRLVHPSFLDGEAPVSASATTAPHKAHTYDGRHPYAEARALDMDGIKAVVADYARAAALAMAAGFDGVQVHAANGYLIDQFLRDSSNQRTDSYGASIDNRIRLLREVTEAVATIVGAERTAVRLSPNGDSQGVNDSDPHALFPAAAAALAEIGIAYLELREPPKDGTFGKAEVEPVERAEAALASGEADAISFGRPFISNPDLVARLESGADLAPDDKTLWYSQGAEGYIDYPAQAA